LVQGPTLKVVIRPVASDRASIARTAPFVSGRAGVATATDLLLRFMHVRLGVARPCSEAEVMLVPRQIPQLVEGIRGPASAGALSTPGLCPSPK
jgi:hypothetical protein